MTELQLQYQILQLPKDDSRSAAWPTLRKTIPWVVGIVALSGVGLSYLSGRLAVAGDERDERDERGSPPKSASEHAHWLTHTVQPIDLEVTTLANGTLESASSSAVHSEVEGQASIVKLVPEGTPVELGDVVVELDSSALRTRLTEQQIVVEKARNACSQALQANAIAENRVQKDIASAELALEFARLDVEKYEQGDYPVRQRALQIEIVLAEADLGRARTQLRFSDDLAKDGYLHQSELDVDRFRVTQAQYKLDNARENARLLEQYEHPRTQRDLAARVVEAERSLAVVKEVAEINARQAATNLEAEQRTLALEELKLEHLQSQIEKCILHAPRAGFVVYPVPPDEDLQEQFIKQGNPIRERQHVFSIPDTDVLQVSTSVHEAVVNQIRPGMQARVWVDAYPELELHAEVQSVSRFPDELGDWRRSTVKFYETKVKLLDQTEGLRPGMSAKVEILRSLERGVLAVPVQAIVQRGHTGLCYVLGSAPELRRVRVGHASLEYIAVLEGLSAGERVVLSPDLLGIPAEALDEVDGPTWDPEAPAAPASAVAAEVVEEEQETQYEAELLGPGGLSGEAEYEITTSSAGTEYEFELKVQGGTPLATWDVVVDGVVIGSIVLDAAGAHELEWKSEHGAIPGNFPLQAGAGSTVVVGPDLRGTLALP